MVQIDLCQLSLLEVDFLTEIWNEILKEFPQVVRMINENLQKLLDFDCLLTDRVPKFRFVLVTKSQSDDIICDSLH